jgi:hypothetical protein
VNALCDQCRGACCETWAQTCQTKELRELADGRTLATVGLVAFLACRCRHLTTDGLCGVYESRPLLCRQLVPGSQDCLLVMRALRPEPRGQEAQNKSCLPAAERLKIK